MLYFISVWLQKICSSTLSLKWWRLSTQMYTESYCFWLTEIFERIVAHLERNPLPPTNAISYAHQRPFYRYNSEQPIWNTLRPHSYVHEPNHHPSNRNPNVYWKIYIYYYMKHDIWNFLVVLVVLHCYNFNHFFFHSYFNVYFLLLLDDKYIK